MVSDIFYFQSYLGKIPILTNIFQMGWNHELETHAQSQPCWWPWTGWFQIHFKGFSARDVRFDRIHVWSSYLHVSIRKSSIHVCRCTNPMDPMCNVFCFLWHLHRRWPTRPSQSAVAHCWYWCRSIWGKGKNLSYLWLKIQPAQKEGIVKQKMSIALVGEQWHDLIELMNNCN